MAELVKKRITDHDFPSPITWAESKQLSERVSISSPAINFGVFEYLVHLGAAFILCEDDEEDESKDDFQAVLDFMLSDYAQQGL